MIELTITPKRNDATRKTWWFVEWPEGGKVSPAKEMNLMDIVYSEMQYTGTVGFCVQYPDNHVNDYVRKALTKQGNYHVMFVDEIYYQTRHGSGVEYLQRKHYEHIVGMAFKDKESAELFKYRIEVRFTYKALQADYS